MRYLLDTSVVSQPTKPAQDAAFSDWLRKQLPANLFVSVITITELRSGIEQMPAGKRRTGFERYLEQVFPAHFKDRILPVTASTADACGRLLAASRANGYTVDPFDALIAATAIEYGLRVVTLNAKHFAHLQVPTETL